jgi:hypothetical protein
LYLMKQAQCVLDNETIWTNILPRQINSIYSFIVDIDVRSAENK